jgi:hypothetical protein
MSGGFDPNVQKSAVFSAPFRRQFFEPTESPFSRPFTPKFLIPPPISTSPPEPTVGPNGEKYFRLSDVKRQLEADLQATEEEVHQQFVDQLAFYLTENWKRKETSQLESDPADDDDLPSFYH